jgi:hypothetical protein
LVKASKPSLTRRQSAAHWRSQLSFLTRRCEKCKTKTLFVSQFSPEVTAEDVYGSIKEKLGLKKLVCTRLKIKYNTYASFHISIAKDDFPLINDSGVWPDGCLIAPYCGKLMHDQVFTPLHPAREYNLPLTP